MLKRIYMYKWIEKKSKMLRKKSKRCFHLFLLYLSLVYGKQKIATQQLNIPYVSEEFRIKIPTMEIAIRSLCRNVWYIFVKFFISNLVKKLTLDGVCFFFFYFLIFLWLWLVIIAGGVVWMNSFAKRYGYFNKC